MSPYQDGMTNIFEQSSQQQRLIRNMILGMVYQNPILGLKMDFSSIGNIAEKLIAAGDRNVRSHGRQEVKNYWSMYIFHLPA